MPFLFKTSNKNGSVAGIGVFAEEDIPKGVVIWMAAQTEKGIPTIGAPNKPNLVFDKENIKEFLDGKSP